MRIIPKVRPQPQRCQTGIWAAKTSESGPQRPPCKMPGASTERTITSAPATGVGPERAEDHIPRAFNMVGRGRCPGLSPRASRAGPHVLAQGRDAGCGGPSCALTFGLRTRAQLFPGLTTIALAIHVCGMNEAQDNCVNAPLFFILSHSCSSICFPTNSLCVGTCLVLWR